MKRVITILIAAAMLSAMLFSLSACGRATKTIPCSRCGADISVPADFEPDSGWTYICDACDQEIADTIADAH